MQNTEFIKNALQTLIYLIKIIFFFATKLNGINYKYNFCLLGETGPAGEQGRQGLQGFPGPKGKYRTI